MATDYYPRIESDQKFQQLEKKINDIQFEGAKTYDTLADAVAVDPKPADGTGFKVSKVTDAANAGNYTFQSGEANGVRFESSFGLTEADKSETGPVENGTKVTTEGQLFNTDLTSKVNNLNLDGSTYAISHFNGVNSDVLLGDSYSLDTTGDFLEIDFRDDKLPADGAAKSLYMIGTNSSSRNMFGVYDSNQIRLRQNVDNDPYKVWNTTLFKVKQFNLVRLDVISDGASGQLWQLTVNGVVIGTATKEAAFIIDKVGKTNGTGNTFAKVSIRKIRIKTATQDKTFKNLLTTGKSPVSVIDKVIQRNSPGFLSFDSNGYDTDKPQFTAYTQIKDDLYCGFNIGKYVKPVGDRLNGQNSDQFRLLDAHLYYWNGSAMVSLGQRVLTPDENECVFQVSGDGGISGGVHGNEFYQTVKFFADGFDLGNFAALSNFNFKPMKEFKYVQYSDIFKYGQSSNIKIVERGKETTVKGLGFESRNRLHMMQNLTLDPIYTSLVCVDASLVDTAMNPKMEQRTLTHSAANGSTQYLQYRGQEMKYWSEKFGLGINIYSTIENDYLGMNRTGNVSTKDNDLYAKFYRILNNKTFGLGDDLDCYTKFELKM